jgi:Pyruvate phosphate dikinase, AMP/ATP-binding domain
MTVIPAFDRAFFASADLCTRIGDGAVGGKAQGLLDARAVIDALDLDPAWGIEVRIPRMVVITTAVFDEFLAQNALGDLAEGGLEDERIAHAFTQASLPAEWLGDFRAIVEEVHTPLAVRSSSLLEDAMHRPFAGVYATKMIPNDQPDADARFQRLMEAVKFVYASTFFAEARRYRRAAAPDRPEKMAVLVQEVIGTRHDERFYPTVSGVAKSHNYYPVGSARREDGVVLLALGLGKTIVDGGRCWVYAPTRPSVAPPYASVGELLDSGQREFWAVRMGPPPVFDPTIEDEFLVRGGLEDAEYDGTLSLVASTYDPGSDRLYPGLGRPGPRAVDFAPVLKLRQLRLNEVVQDLMDRCARAFDAPVEIEFAVATGRAGGNAQFGFVQVRPMVRPGAAVEVADAEWNAGTMLARSDRALGNGVDATITDIVYVRPDRFTGRDTPRIADELRAVNDALVAASRPYVLIGFGRWGSSDPWLGIPVAWADIAGARVLVEATLPAMDVEASQGAHFFHNLSGFQISYLWVHHDATPGIAWDWLDALPAVTETHLIRHVRSPAPLVTRVDGRTGRGGIWRPADGGEGGA